MVVQRVFELRSCDVLPNVLYLSVRRAVAQGAEDLSTYLPIIELERGSAK